MLKVGKFYKTKISFSLYSRETEDYIDRLTAYEGVIMAPSFFYVLERGKMIKQSTSREDFQYKILFDEKILWIIINPELRNYISLLK